VACRSVNDRKGTLSGYYLDLAPEVFMDGQHLAQLGERPHDLDVDLDGSVAIESAGKHGHALFGKGPHVF
jgi:hypothetical protein